MLSVESLFRMIEVSMALLGGPLYFLSKRYPQQSWLYSAAFLWQLLFLGCLSALKCVSGIDPVTEPTVFESLVQFYLELWI